MANAKMWTGLGATPKSATSAAGAILFAVAWTVIVAGRTSQFSLLLSLLSLPVVLPFSIITLLVLPEFLGTQFMFAPYFISALVWLVGGQMLLIRLLPRMRTSMAASVLSHLRLRRPEQIFIASTLGVSVAAFLLLSPFSPVPYRLAPGEVASHLGTYHLTDGRTFVVKRQETALVTYALYNRRGQKEFAATPPLFSDVQKWFFCYDAEGTFWIHSSDMDDSVYRKTNGVYYKEPLIDWSDAPPDFQKELPETTRSLQDDQLTSNSSHRALIGRD